MEPAINSDAVHRLIDEEARKSGLKELRTSNFKYLLRRLKKYKPGGGRLLDVGCAHGWFLEAACEDFDVVGLEPDMRIFNVTSAKGLPVVNGFFPDALNKEEVFDIIIFNDVFEHIPNANFILDSCRKHLKADGLLILNVPSSSGIFYRLAKLLQKCGACGFFERLWQKGLPSPHLHYFNDKNLCNLLEKNQFSIEKVGSLPALQLKGLYTRISYTGKMSVIYSLLIYVLVAVTLPVLRACSADIIYIFAKK